MVRREYVVVSFGQLHVTRSGLGTTAGAQPPVVLLHQTPRSADEFREVIAELATSVPALEVIAPDLPGMGGSDDHPDGATIEHYAAAVLEALDALGVQRFDLVGHHTGGCVAVEVAARAGRRTRRLVLSSTPFVDEDGRAMRAARDPIDAVDIAGDGSHLTTLWQRRLRFYPPDRPDLLQRFVADALVAAEPEAGHLAVARYVMEDRIAAVTADVLLVGHEDDPYAFPELPAMQRVFPAAQVVTIPGGMVPLEFTAPAFSAALTSFLLATVRRG